MTVASVAVMVAVMTEARAVGVEQEGLWGMLGEAVVVFRVPVQK